MIIDEQIKLHFGDGYDYMLNNARKFVKTNYQLLIGWGAERDRILDCEGGRKGLLRRALCSIIEEGDDEAKGLRAYGTYMAHEYTPIYQKDLHIADISIPHFAERNLNLGSIDAPTNVDHLAFRPVVQRGSDLSEPPKQSLDVLVEGWGLDQDEYDLATLLGNNNRSLKDAGRVLGWDRKHVLRVYGRLRDRVAPKGAAHRAAHRPAPRPAVVSPMSATPNAFIS